LSSLPFFYHKRRVSASKREVHVNADSRQWRWPYQRISPRCRRRSHCSLCRSRRTAGGVYERLKEAFERNLREVLRLGELLVDEQHGPYPVLILIECISQVSFFDGIRSEFKQRANHPHVVFHPMVALPEQHFLLLEGGIHPRRHRWATFKHPGTPCPSRSQPNSPRANSVQTRSRNLLYENTEVIFYQIPNFSSNRMGRRPTMRFLSERTRISREMHRYRNVPCR
jgi:hypothetical protein